MMNFPYEITMKKKLGQFCCPSIQNSRTMRLNSFRFESVPVTHVQCKADPVTE